MKLFIRALSRLYTQRVLIRELVFHEVRARYAGTLGGFMWSFIHPMLTLFIFWFVFSMVLRVQPMHKVPFIAMFACGMIPWTLLSESLSMSVRSIVSNTHLVKKTVFPTEILPIVQVMVGAATHLVMLVVLFIILWFSHISFSLWNFQVAYYLFALICLSAGLGWLFASLNVFQRDIGEILPVILNIWFWLTPIVWEVQSLPEGLQPLAKLNPIYYIVEGYRASLIYHQPFWHDGLGGLYFWSFCGCSLVLGGYVFMKLKPELAEML